ncbi:hypothetical protein BSBH6_00572 [Bacillus subtilis]|nr:hypothetical protein BSBH6_00572 [Bacillus subtilis]RPK26935.1 hypothetical protein BH5_00570 [Bacillus subtilis]
MRTIPTLKATKARIIPINEVLSIVFTKSFFTSLSMVNIGFGARNFRDIVNLFMKYSRKRHRREK